MNTQHIPSKSLSLAAFALALLAGGCQWYLPQPGPTMPPQDDCQIDADFNIDCSDEFEPGLGQG